MRATSEYKLNDNQAYIILKALKFMADSKDFNQKEKSPMREVYRAMDIQRRRALSGKRLGGQGGIVDKDE